MSFSMVRFAAVIALYFKNECNAGSWNEVFVGKFAFAVRRVVVVYGL
jgi:hypothetical protein